VTTQVALTGGSGVVGSAIVRHLVDSGSTPRCLSRNEESDDVIRALGGSPIRGDILDTGSLDAAFQGTDVVYHVAGVNQMCAEDTGPMYRANIQGSVNVVEACHRAGVDRLVYTSSAAAIGEPPGVVGSESTVHRGWYLSNYERSKHLAEMAVTANSSGLDLVIVNPSSVQGPGRATGTGKLILDLLNGRLPLLVDTRVSIVDIDDCASAHLLAATKGRPGRRYVINSFTMDLRDAVELVSDLSGRPLTTSYVPDRLLSAGGLLAGVASRLPLSTVPICREMMDTLRHGHVYDGSLAERELGLRYAKPKETLGRLIEWFRSEGLLEP
jgi:dihydroflavonol-4-reductase